MTTNGYPITAPVEFETSTTGAQLNFNANGPIIGTGNRILNMVTTTAGDLVYRAVGGLNVLERLPVGTAGQVLTVAGGLPSWATPTIGTATKTFNATATATGATKALTGTTWTTVTNALVTWDTSTNGNNDAGAIFNTTTGVFTVPETGIYELSGSAEFEANNSTSTLFAGRRATRQARIFNTTTSRSMNNHEEQAAASANNPTKVNLSSTRMSLTAADALVLQVRHDAIVSLNILGDTVSIVTYFSACKVA